MGFGPNPGIEWIMTQQNPTLASMDLIVSHMFINHFDTYLIRYGIHLNSYPLLFGHLHSNRMLSDGVTMAYPCGVKKDGIKEILIHKSALPI